MKFTEEKLEQAFVELLGDEGYPHCLGSTISRVDDEVEACFSRRDSAIRECFATRVCILILKEIV